MSPARRRQCAEHVREQTGSSERKICAVLGQNRTTQRYTSSVREFSVLVRQAVINYASEYGRYGYRAITDLLRMDGWGISYNRVERIWKQEGLKVPAKQRPRKRLWLNDGSCVRLRPEWKNHVWAYDFVHCRTVNGKAFRVLVVIDEYSRECLALHVARTIRAEQVMHVLADLFLTHGRPDNIRSDNGPEYVSARVQNWAKRRGIRLAYTQPGKPQQNSYVERYNRTVRYDWLNQYLFESL